MNCSIVRNKKDNTENTDENQRAYCNYNFKNILSLTLMHLDNVLKGLILVLAFWIGFKYSKTRNAVDCPAAKPIENLALETKPVNSKISSISSCKHSKSHSFCSESYRSLIPFQSISAESVLNVFSDLHHPASPSKKAVLWSNNLNETKGISNCNLIYLTRTGSRANQPNKCLSVIKVPKGGESIYHHSFRRGITAGNTDQYQKDYARDYSLAEEMMLLPPTLRDIDLLRRQFLDKLGSPLTESGSRRQLLVMVANEGVIDLLLNFLCSLEPFGKEIDWSSIVVFVGNSALESTVEHMGVKAFFHPALGAMPTHAAGYYMDKTFSRMMWFKTVSQYLALTSGFDVLFQDVDLVWLKNPWHLFTSIEGDILFMDDGARTPRYTPYYTNSGFYLLRYNTRTVYFQEKMLKCGPSEIGFTHSHQSVLIRHLSEAAEVVGLRSVLLDQEEFVSGQLYHENKKKMKEIQLQSYRPAVFHMCWTDNRASKLLYLKEMKLWFVSSTDLGCGSADTLVALADKTVAPAPSSTLRDRCCMKSLYWPPYLSS